MTNPFSPNYKPQLSALTQTPRQKMLNGLSPQECKEFILANAKNAIHITSQQESDRTNAIKFQRREQPLAGALTA